MYDWNGLFNCITIFLECCLSFSNIFLKVETYSILYSIGTGFFIDYNGHILTCAHCLINSQQIYVEIPSEGNKKYQASIFTVIKVIMCRIDIIKLFQVLILSFILSCFFKQSKTWSLKSFVNHWILRYKCKSFITFFIHTI